MVIPNLGEIEVVPETRIENETTESEKERKRKQKVKMVESPTKGDKRRYTTKRAVQKLLRNSLVENEEQINRNRRRRMLLHVPSEEPTSVPQNIGSSETVVRSLVK
ncbi:hypothetical protein KY290_037013 [Solanum tuberosum]|uniref:Uncharacterized protein n=1 Tax=Solanum tuberosum TaxID=4113 RepID=A0ABQ7TVT3_SOLTU|nr:hypothetical protein KY289_036503 [Solanum tuberosum]KAH0738308.1 hypothetical protein KY290_037013 [Solanum tuberosum]